MMVGIRTNRLELDELWSFVGKKQKRVKRHEIIAKGDQYVFIGLAGTQKAIVSYHVGKRDSDNTDRFVRDLRERVIGLPEISTDGFLPYLPAIGRGRLAIFWTPRWRSSRLRRLKRRQTGGGGSG